ncbi:MAG: twin-arginine translocation pathway signal protein, partial [bacterium]
MGKLPSIVTRRATRHRWPRATRNIWAAAVILVLGAVAFPAADAAARPNVLIFVADDLGGADV